MCHQPWCKSGLGRVQTHDVGHLLCPHLTEKQEQGRVALRRLEEPILGSNQMAKVLGSDSILRESHLVLY